ncbi:MULTISPECIES: ThiF family adenylyltransferase [Frankia]|uniref:THIF-type NAD/FAD binding fold domain-containing protein n=1 Tax=Frankia alni (strain DSM 45986 / CECT 9034 / ACN14a) TaxID=326424 RepID=Q0RSD9_FRAAA|nr:MULTISPECIES: ThiF family adenylyltransferase [Frankia]CAJ59524.1 hypothetical protein FRAAL0856 [Frankia alni ACN14a]
MTLAQPRRRIPDPRDRNARLAWLDGWWDRSTVHLARVAVVGVGALGNEILKNLALLDFRQVTIIDRDTVERSNLSRSVLFRPRHEGQPKVTAAADTLADLNPALRVDALHADVVHETGLGHLRGQDVILAGLDSRRVRWWLNRTARALGVPWVEGATQGPHGHAMAFLPGAGPCYECTFTDQDWRALDDVASCRQLALDAAVRGRVATSPTAASIVAAAQVHLAMDLLHGRPVVGGRSLLVNLEAPDLMVSGRPENPACEAHTRFEPVLDTALSARTATVGDLLAAAAPTVGEPATVELRWDSVWEFDCAGCGRTSPVRRARGLVPHSTATCPDCGAERRPVFRHRLGAEDAGLSLAAVGIPPLDVVEVRGPAGSAWLELAGDRAEAVPTGTDRDSHP